MKILVACEESQAVCKAFRAKGHEAWSCDIESCSGGHPEWHIQGDVVPLLNETWDIVIAFPPCTHLAVSGARWFPEKRKDGRQQAGIDFFKLFTRLDCPKVAIENPVGIMSNLYRKPDQIIQPWQFGHNASKQTCLWLKGLPELEPLPISQWIKPALYCCGQPIKNNDRYGCPFCLGEKSPQQIWANQTPTGQNNIGPSDKRQQQRSLTYQGIANAMSEQWG